MKSAIVLCSGGLDSVTTAFYIKKRLKYKKIFILFFNYGQRTLAIERKFSKLCAKEVDADFLEIDIENLGKISTSLLNSKKEHRRMKRGDLKDLREESEKWYVPCRNLVFLSYALALAESVNVKEKIDSYLFVGFKNEGRGGYPDTSQEFLDSLNKTARVSTIGKYKILAPLINKDKEDIVTLAKNLGVDFKKTFSCYTGSHKHCGTCLACKLRQEGFYWANVKDPTD
ncbi:MAG: 7-cyano-7-deazaguanine synthase QueC, partial [Nanoarchaeota archaeon]